MGILKKIGSCCSSIILIIILFLLNIVFFFRTSIIDKQLYMDTINKTSIVKSVESSIKEEIDYVMKKNNISNYEINQVITESEIQKHLDKSIDNIIEFYKGDVNEIENIEVSKYVDRLRVMINNYIAKEEIVNTYEVSQAVTQILNLSEEIISKEIEPIDYNSFSKSKYGNSIQEVTRVLSNNKFFVGVIILFICTSTFICVINRKKIYDGLNYIGYSFIISGILSSLIYISGYLSKFYRNINVVSENLNKVISTIIEYSLIKLSFFAIIIFIIGIIIRIYCSKKINKLGK